MGTQHRTWSTFCDAVHKVSITKLKEKLEVEDEQQEVLAMISCLEELQKLPTRAVRQAMGTVSLAHPILAPRFAIQPAAPMPALWFTIQPTAPAALTPSLAPMPVTSQYCPDAERLVDVVCLALLIHHKTPVGRVAYQAQVAKWSTQNGDDPVNEMWPYPLSPGTSPVASSECWKCRLLGHLGTVCPSPEQVPLIEQK